LAVKVVQATIGFLTNARDAPKAEGAARVIFTWNAWPAGASSALPIGRAVFVALAGERLAGSELAALRFAAFRVSGAIWNLLASAAGPAERAGRTVIITGACRRGLAVAVETEPSWAVRVFDAEIGFDALTGEERAMLPGWAFSVF
jgi:hypothetical protein